MSTETPKETGLYYSVIDGTLRRRVEEGTPGSVRREYETKDGGKGVKHELVFDSLEGFIEEIGCHDTEFGHQLVVKLDPNSEGKNPIVTFSLETAFGRDVLRKVPGVDFTKQVKFRPYAFIGDSGDEVRGVEVSQGDTKLTDHFWDKEEKKPINGAPAAEGDTSEYTKDDWKIHFLKLSKYQREYFATQVYPRFLAEKPKQEREVVQDDYVHEPSPEELNDLDTAEPEN